ncbi:uncharacterized protein LAJ45_03516 [Morchella importuna]|uniref:uncharacterized protein n=1 Tax=Morchella importuna TaxID=1174673 RepID=UPI001E8DED76|nr:uncharacterized protein LAJ45_03516 [Morchella importuna]KAH8152675.1 hypothetical protein LAJ45_03516 [Morchella importuna]
MMAWQKGISRQAAAAGRDVLCYDFKKGGRVGEELRSIAIGASESSAGRCNAQAQCLQPITPLAVDTIPTFLLQVYESLTVTA